MILALAGGVGAARFLRGLVAVADASVLTVVVNVADDEVLHGLHVSPDLDTITYSMAGAVDGERGWGLDGESWVTIDALERFTEAAPVGSAAGSTWFRLGDKDLATHLYRTQRLREGATLSTIAAELASAWGVTARIVPVTDDRLRTVFRVGGESMAFQEYFVRHRHEIDIEAVSFEGATQAKPAPGVIAEIGRADTIVVCPSNPIVSVGPILAVPGIREALADRRDQVVAVSPIVGGAAVRGPADRLMAAVGHEPSVVGVARMYSPIASALVIDTVDAHLAGAVEEAGLRAVVAPSVMRGQAEAEALARVTIEAAL